MFIHDQIHFRKLAEHDLRYLTELKSESWLGTHQITIASFAEQKEWLSNLCHNVHSPRNLVLIANTDDAPNAKIGIFKAFNVDYINGTADVGWDLFAAHRGKGLGRPLVAAGCAFCFDILALRRLTAEILINNTASLKCAKGAGFVQEGCKRQAVHRLGDYIDSMVLGLLRDDCALQPKIRPV